MITVPGFETAQRQYENQTPDDYYGFDCDDLYECEICGYPADVSELCKGVCGDCAHTEADDELLDAFSHWDGWDGTVVSELSAGEKTEYISDNYEVWINFLNEKGRKKYGNSKTGSNGFHGQKILNDNLRFARSR